MGHELDIVPTDTPALPWARHSPDLQEAQALGRRTRSREKPGPLLSVLNLHPSFCSPFATNHSLSPPSRPA